MNLILEGLTVSLKIDTNNYVNILPMSHYKKMKRKVQKKPTKTRLTSYTGDRIPIMVRIGNPRPIGHIRPSSDFCPVHHLTLDRHYISLQSTYSATNLWNLNFSSNPQSDFYIVKWKYKNILTNVKLAVVGSTSGGCYFPLQCRCLWVCVLCVLVVRGVKS